MGARRLPGPPFVLVAALLAGCPLTPRDDEPPAATGSEEVVRRSDLFVADPLWPANVVFFTNDERLWGPYGTTLWAPAGSEQVPFTARTVTAAKTSGDGSAGFGVIFCQYDTGDPTVGETMLVAMINTKREYMVGEVAGCVFRELVPWTTSESLQLGYNAKNTLALSFDAGSGEFVLALNGTEAARFRDDDPPLHTSGADGYLVVISPLDRFPDAPVRVVFEEQSGEGGRRAPAYHGSGGDRWPPPDPRTPAGGGR